jgi:hypothetical protein
MRALVVAALLALLHAGAAHAGDPPELLAPGEGATLPQDNLFAECTIYGLGWDFAWSDAGAGARYELQVERAGGPAPYARLEVAEPRARVGRCGCLPDALLADWRWRVRAQANGSDWSEWSAWRGFQVAPLATCLHIGQEN